MSGKGKNPDVKVLKGLEAEGRVLEYVKGMNRPYGAVDVSANLKGAVPKTATQKILVALAEKGELVQKTYGKTTFFVANQARMEEMSPEKLTVLETEYKSLEEENKLREANIKVLSGELARLKASLTDTELHTQTTETAALIKQTAAQLDHLRSGAPPISAQELVQLDTDWVKWKSEWVRRKKIFTTFWQLATDALPPHETSSLAEDLGIEIDTGEHMALERSPLFLANYRNVPNILKRKRELGS